MTEDQQADLEPPKLPMLPASIKYAVLAEIESLSAFVPEISLEDWAKPSAAGGWSIGDVVAHLNLALGLYSRVVDAIVAGRGSGGIWRAFGQLTKRAAPMGSPVFNAINSALPRMMGGTLSPEVLKGQFAANCRTLKEKLDKVGSVDYTRPAHYMGRPWPLSFFLAAVVNELAIHGWDMRSRLESDAHLGAEARAVLPWFYWGATSYMLHRPSGLSGVIQASLADPTTEMWWSLTDEGITQGAGQATNAGATITGESGIFVLVLAGRIPAADALRTTSLTVSGSEETALAFLGAWKIS
jgi:uncharacterized protein (TIGR03083 family)